jgi:DNA-3-methyladenine glycosylase
VTTLPPDFYDRPVLQVARELIGCTVEHAGAVGVIVETEAYHESEPASHAFAGLTPRTRTLFGEPGRAYVYRSYGVHVLLNAVCERPGVGAGVLIRALDPIVGLEEMRARRWPAGARGGPGAGANGAHAGAEGHGARKRPSDRELCSGPGKLTQALGITLEENAGDLSSGPVLIHSRAEDWLEPDVVEGTRVGITVAVDLPWRFCVRENRHVSHPRPPAGRAR